MEKMRGYSVITLFNLVDVSKKKFVSPVALHAFMLE
jgi:hypothetical protein